jgi:glutamate racemase
MLPNEDLVYFGDTARVPYGSKSAATVKQYSFEIADFLLEKNIKLLVIACNTATAFALEEMQKAFSIPVIGVIEPGVQALRKYDLKLEKAAVLATRSTIKSKAYLHASSRIIPGLHLYSKATPLLVPLVEEGFINKKVTESIIAEYFDDIIREDINHVILGCTHYPMLIPVIQRLYPQIYLVDSSIETAKAVKGLLDQHSISSEKSNKGSISIFVSDLTDSFNDLENIFAGNIIHNVHQVKLDEKERT